VVWTFCSAYSRPLSFAMGPTLRAEPIGPGEELRCATKRGPSIRVETDTLTHPGMNPESVVELLTRPVHADACASA